MLVIQEPTRHIKDSVVNDENRQNHHDHCCLLVILIEFDLFT